nr:GNAT family N-acetyltransferase [uncultured Leptotrichia sp.]
MELKKENLIFRFATEEDAEKILKIYKPYVENTTITFEYEVPSVDEFKGRIKEVSEKYPYIVCEYENEIAGYAYAHKIWDRAAYQWDAELSVYTDEKFAGNRIGKKLYGILIKILKLQNIVNVYGLVTYPNENSEKLHNYFGFKKTAYFENSGYKFGKWIGVTWFEKAINEHFDNLKPVRKISEIDEIKLRKILKFE